jgi:hypothetical protein
VGGARVVAAARFIVTRGARARHGVTVRRASVGVNVEGRAE